MPTYTYACTACGHTFDAVQAFSDNALTTCPECEGALRKVYNAVGVVFKGSGFYRTDARAGNSSSKASTAASSAASSEGSSSTPTPA
jgi:putative FmdB family regulatory protein